MEAELLALTQRLLDAIATGDCATYQELCDPSLTAFEPEGRGQRVDGLEFHKFYFDRGAFRERRQTTMAAPHVRIMGEAAVVTCVRLVQKTGPEGQPATIVYEETRIWQRIDGRWRHKHFHRSAPS